LESPTSPGNPSLSSEATPNASITTTIDAKKAVVGAIAVNVVNPANATTAAPPI
jgi:hypothetical protein